MRTRRGLPLAVAAALLAAACSRATAIEEPQPASTTTTTVAALQATPATTAPTTSTTTTTTTTTTTLPPKERVVIHATGDVNLDPGYIPAFRNQGYDYAWTGLDGLFATDDLTIVNLECSASNQGSAQPKAFVFRCDPDALPVMRDAGVEVANLGNNHSQDYGPAAMLDARRNLEATDIAPVGAGKNDIEAHQPAVFDIGGWRIAVLGFGGVVPTPAWIAGPDHPGMADGDTIDTMVAAVEAAAKEADLVLVAIHWGVELDTTPRPDDRERAEAMIAAGADAIFGHHAHRLQPLEIVDGKPVFWGLGNFVWPNFSVAGSTTAVAEIVIEPDGAISACLLPAFIEAPGHPVLDEAYGGPCAEE